MRLHGVFSLVLVALSAAALPSGSATADTGPYGSFYVDNAVSYNCDARYQYSLAPPAGYTDDITVEFESVAPDGDTTGYDYDFDAPLTNSGFIGFCGSDLAGTFEAILSVQACDSDYNCVDYEITDLYEVRKPRSKTTLRVNTKNPRKGQVLVFKIGSKDERPRGYFPNDYADVALQQLVAGKWSRVHHSLTDTDDRGLAVLRYRWTGGEAVKVRAVTLRESNLTASRSPAILIR